jgi:putative transposase
LFSSDLNLSHERIIQQYQLRFQIEFIFWDAKQNFSLADFMNISPPAVKNTTNLASHIHDGAVASFVEGVSV